MSRKDVWVDRRSRYLVGVLLFAGSPAAPGAVSVEVLSDTGTSVGKSPTTEVLCEEYQDKDRLVTMNNMAAPVVILVRKLLAPRLPNMVEDPPPPKAALTPPPLPL